MRVGPKIAMVGGVPILIAAAIAVAGWMLLAQAERARGGALLAQTVFRDLTIARMVRDNYVGAPAADRERYAQHFSELTAQAGRDLDSLKSYARTKDQAAKIALAQDALARYVARMADYTRITQENDGLIAEMAQRAETLITLADRARLRQQSSNADLVRSLSGKVEKLSATRDVVAAINVLRVTAAEIALEQARDADGATALPPSALARLRNAGRNLSATLRSDGRRREADELDTLTGALTPPQAVSAGASVDNGSEPGSRLAAWAERLLKIDASGQQTLHDEVSQLLTYSIEANETEQATQNIAISTLKLGQRTANALARRDPVRAETMLGEGERLSSKAANLPISPLIQSEMIDAIDGWRNRLATTIDDLSRQNQMIAQMDRLASDMSGTAQALNDAFIDDADRFGAVIRRLLLVGAAGGLLLGSLAAFAVARSILVPLRQLKGDMIKLAANPGAGTVSGTRRSDELGDIARATDSFVTEIASRERALRRAKDRADAALIDLHQAQTDLIRAEKLASLGQLVGGVAHEINTPLGIALTTATLVRDESRAFKVTIEAGTLSRSRLTHYVDRIGEGAHLLCTNLTRAADLVHGFKQVAVDRVSDDRRTFALDGWLDELLASLQPLLRKGGHEITRKCPTGLVVDTNPGALAQVATNLINNAVVHGFEKGQRGHIAVSVERQGSDHVVLRIADDGVGISKENLARIFDPFFTTARSRGSTGLGMHIVHNLVAAKLHGRIAIESEPGQGTVVRIEFPAGIAATDAPARARLRAG